MKKLIFALLLPLALLSGCDKDDPTVQPSGLQINVTGLTANTRISIHVYKGAELISKLDNAYSAQMSGSLSYTTPAVNPGDVLNVKYKSDKAPASSGDGKADIKFLYKDQQIGSVSGDLGYPDFKTLTVTIP